jgi:hypothetical protein
VNRWVFISIAMVFALLITWAAQAQLSGGVSLFSSIPPAGVACGLIGSDLSNSCNIGTVTLVAR